MVLAVAAPLDGVANPRMSMVPPAASLTPAARAPGRPGVKPMDSSMPAVAVTPPPPNQPNSFCAPCAARMPPTPRRSARRATSLREIAAMVLAPSLSKVVLVNDDSTPLDGQPGGAVEGVPPRGATVQT